MHLLVLGAFWPEVHPARWDLYGLNAPSGAGCFLTYACIELATHTAAVLMHLLVLGAF